MGAPGVLLPTPRRKWHQSTQFASWEELQGEKEKNKTPFSTLLNVSINVFAALLSQDLSGSSLTGWSLKLALVRAWEGRKDRTALMLSGDLMTPDSPASLPLWGPRLGGEAGADWACGVSTLSSFGGGVRQWPGWPLLEPLRFPSLLQSFSLNFTLPANTVSTAAPAYQVGEQRSMQSWRWASRTPSHKPHVKL